MMSVISSILSIICTAMMGYLVWYLQQRFSNKSNSSKALVLLLRRELRELNDRYSERESITTMEYREYEEIYELYHKMGGNGVATRWKEEIDKKPIKG